jgi:hypothetical protein
MRADRAVCRKLETLTTLQGLRVAQGDIALAEAKAARTEAERTETAAWERIDTAMEEYRDMLASASFPADAFRLAGALLNTLEEEATAARDHAGEARATEADRGLRSQNHRHRERQLGALHKAARRKLSRKEEEKAMATAAQLLLHRSGRAVR